MPDETSFSQEFTRIFTKAEVTAAQGRGPSPDNRQPRALRVFNLPVQTGSVAPVAPHIPQPLDLLERELEAEMGEVFP